MSASLLSKVTDDFRQGRELPAELAEAMLDALIAEQDESRLASVLSVWHAKGIEENEIYEFARILRIRMTRIDSKHELFVDIVGTGGSKAKTFNVSTAASFIVAGAGTPVAKHGNRAATSNSGSADVLSELGIDPASRPEKAEQCLNDIGVCFMFAPNFHRLSLSLGKVRRGLGFPTIFNCVGPLCNPASAPHQLIGVWDKSLVMKMARALARLGTKRSWIVYGENGLDEVALAGATFVAEVDKAVRMFEVHSEDFGIASLREHNLRSNGASHSAEMILKTLRGEPHVPAAENIVLLNAAAALLVAGSASSMTEAAEAATASLRSGAAYRKLRELAEANPI